jgi:hypothetical protein
VTTKYFLNKWLNNKERRYQMKKILLTLTLVLGIYLLVIPDTNNEASIFEEDPGPMEFEDNGE